MTDPHRRRAFRRFVSGFAAALGVASGPAGAASAQSISPDAAPPAWIAYAGIVSETVRARLTGDDPAAMRLSDDIARLPGADPQEGITLKVAFWIDGNGRITRIEHAPFAQQPANDDLQALLVGLSLAQSPPEKMLLPLRLAIRIKPKPRTTPASPDKN